MLHEISLDIYSINGIKNKRLQSYCDTIYSRGSENQMCILKNSKDLLKYIHPRFSSSCNNVTVTLESFVFNTVDRIDVQ
jgi:hypothetical protein